MRLSDHQPHRHRLAQVTLFFAALALTALGIAGLSSQAVAGPVTLKIDHARVSMGAFQDVAVIPADDKFPSPMLPTPQRTDIQLNGTQTGDDISIPASTNTGLQFPYMHVLNPLVEGQKIPFTFRLKDPGLKGTYDPATGQTDLTGKMDIVVVTGTGSSFPLPDGLVDAAVPPLSLFARCRIPNVPVSFSTETKFPFTAERYKGSFGTDGALTTAYNGLPTAVSENGGDCSLLALITNGSGGIWLSSGIEKPVAQEPLPDPTCETDSSLCDPEVAISAVKLTPKKKKVKAGKKVKLKVRVKNTGDGDADRLKVTLKSSNKRVKVPKKVVLDVPGGSSATKTITVRVKKAARGKSRITAKTSGKKAVANIKVKPKKKHHRKKHHK